jgi:microcystin-dependent protein
MADPFVGQLLIVGFNFNPVGWQLAAGQLLPISQFTALFSLFGTNFGGDGKSNFALPNMVGNISNGQGQGPGLSDYFIGQSEGTDTVTLLGNENPVHYHFANAEGGARVQGQVSQPNAAMFATASGSTPYAPAGTMNQNLNPLAVGLAGGNQPHNNLMPYLALNWLVCMQGVYPTRP